MQSVRPKKALGQHFLTDQAVAQAIVTSLKSRGPVLEVGPGTGVLTQYLLRDPDVALKVVEQILREHTGSRSHFQHGPAALKRSHNGLRDSLVGEKMLAEGLFGPD